MPGATMTFTGTYGTLVVDATTGRVEEYLPRLDESPDYADITTLDVPEFLQWVRGPVRVAMGEDKTMCFHQRLLRGASVDILTVGYWSTDGSYTPAEPDARDEMLRDVVDFMATLTPVEA